MINKLLLLSFLFMTSCVSSVKPSHRSTSISEYENIHLGSNQELISSILGVPHETISLLKEQPTTNWIYNDPVTPPQQRGNITFDSKKNTVISITFIPRENEPEENLEFLLSKKYASLKFDQYDLKRCSQDFKPAQSFYINTTKGIVIEYDHVRKYVESIHWINSEVLSRKIQKLKKCE